MSDNAKRIHLANIYKAINDTQNNTATWDEEDTEVMEHLLKSFFFDDNDYHSFMQRMMCQINYYNFKADSDYSIPLFLLHLRAIKDDTNFLGKELALELNSLYSYLVEFIGD